jgi:3-oxoacyl-[acyl-carrier protein] reductase
MNDLREQYESNREIPLANKCAIVTGASRGIGRAIALSLAHLGANIVVTARDSEKLNNVAASIREESREVHVVPGDLRDPGFPARLVDSAVAKFANVDIVVNNAGATRRGSFFDMKIEDWTDGFALKFFGAALLCQAAWPHLVRRKGSIVNIAGTGGRTPDADFTVGGPVNAALLSFTKALAEIGITDGVQVNCINPGLIRTDRLIGRIAAASKRWGVSDDEAAHKMLKEYGITHFGKPEDIGALVGFIVSPCGRLFHGSLIDIDGGWTKTI